MLRGQLFTKFYLEDGIRETEEYRALPDADVAAFAAEVKSRWMGLGTCQRQ